MLEGDLGFILVAQEFKTCFMPAINQEQVWRVVWFDESHLWCVPEEPFVSNTRSITRFQFIMIEWVLKERPTKSTIQKKSEDIEILISKLALKINALCEKALACKSGISPEGVREIVLFEFREAFNKMEDIEKRLALLEKEWFN